MQSYAKFHVPQTILYGRDSLSVIGEQVAVYGSKALIISDRIMEAIGNLAKCDQYLKAANIAHVSYLEVNSEPTDVHVQQSLDICLQKNCQVIIALGGGSCIDTAKAVAVLATNAGYIGDYTSGGKQIKSSPVPLIVIPTTAGTGSEVTDVTVITNTRDNVKMMIKHLAFMPRVAIVDPLLTESLPAHVTAATGVDALCHAIEAYISRKSHPLTDTLALNAIKLISENLMTVYKDGANINARENMSLAAMQAGMAFSNASVCLVHGMSRPIGAMFHVPHGVSNAMLLPAVLEFTKNSAMERLAEIGRVLKPELIDAADEVVASGFIRDIRKLCQGLNIPNLKNWGIKREELEKVVSKMAKDALTSGSPNNNPWVPTAEQVIDLYKYCYDYEF